MGRADTHRPGRAAQNVTITPGAPATNNKDLCLRDRPYFILRDDANVLHRFINSTAASKLTLEFLRTHVSYVLRHISIISLEFVTTNQFNHIFFRRLLLVILGLTIEQVREAL